MTIDQNELLEQLQARLEYEVNRGNQHYAHWDADERRIHAGRVEGMRIMLGECFAFFRERYAQDRIV